MSIAGNQITKIGIIGAGYMGSMHARILQNMPGAGLAGVFDVDDNKAKECASKYETVAFVNIDQLFSVVDAVIIAVPTEQHFAYSLQALNNGLDILVEKPIGSSLDEAAKLCDAASNANRILQVGHVERFNPVCFELPRLVKDPMLMTFERLSPYTPSWIGNSGVIVDLMIHDLDIALSLVKDRALHIDAVSSSIMSDTEDLALAHVVFGNGAIAHFTSSRVSQAKIRKLTITQADEYISADLLHTSIAIHHYVSSEYYFDRRMGFRQETVTEIPYLSRQGEPLRLELESFVESVQTRRPPIVSGEDGMEALALALEIMRVSLATDP